MRYQIILLLVILSACTTFKPQALDYASVDFDSPKHHMDYGVYTPPNWQHGESLPVILLLHGGGGSHLSFERYGSAEFLDQEINAGNIPRVIIVTPDGNNGFWENWSDGSYLYRDWVLDTVLPKVQREYQTLPCPEHCHLAGISMGGFGVLRIAYAHRDRFSSVSSISAPIYSDQQANEQQASWLARRMFPLERIFGNQPSVQYRKGNPYNAWIDDPEQQTMRLQLIWGDDDHARIKRANEIFHQRLQENNVPHDYYVYSGRHKWVDWIPNFTRMINFSLAENDEARSDRTSAY